MAKILIVDDSALMRRHLKEILEAKGGYEVMAVRNGVEALEALEPFQPDVITLDVNMPEMDGLTCLSHIMARRPTPVVMVSSLTQRGAEVTFEALALGAVDFIHKPDGTISLNVDRVEREILEKVKAASRARLRRSTGLQQRLRDQRADRSDRRERQGGGGASPSARLAVDDFGVVIIGVSTGGPGTLEEILPCLPADFPWPVVVAQHMPGSFTAIFARRLNDMCRMPVIEAAQMMPLKPGVIYIAKGDADVVIGKRATGWVVNPMPGGSQFLWHPSVERLVDSALHAMASENVIGVLLTGMGDDGADSMCELKRRGGHTIAQDEASSVIWGMPGELVKRGGADLVLPAGRIAGQLTAWLKQTVTTREDRHGAR
ncbi:protein-glutamate methylesterase/protein-glutamine glutaminase [Telmatospirillum siberiense]|uniref:Protein-glutamate methylesterase/protein-glutamine glutaminase n=1 Tax=Telmatospirillum siberiense TaxID=382514 RepID=A0A2N3Q1S7_9PROT|nr:chemotaxis response regulator protein-glutamate methylesterase [Telmatospirillum siberiense]PKU26609.1 chemotaxis response regulator protein-glutamate methylesterase [Telmatospirillum siberiense]